MSTQQVDPAPETPHAMERFFGTWILLSSVTDGEPAAEDDILGVRVEISNGTETVWVRDQIVAHEIPFSIDFSVEPFQTTDYLPGGSRINGICKLDGDLLISCVSRPDQLHPQSFTSLPHSGHILRVFKRQDNP